MKVDIEKKTEQVATTKEEDVIHLELSRDEAILILLCMAGHSCSSVDKNLRDWEGRTSKTHNFGVALSMIGNKLMFPTLINGMFEKLNEEIIK